MDSIEELEKQAYERRAQRKKFAQDELTALDLAQEAQEHPETRDWFAGSSDSTPRIDIEARLELARQREEQQRKDAADFREELRLKREMQDHPQTRGWYSDLTVGGLRGVVKAARSFYTAARDIAQAAPVPMFESIYMDAQARAQFDAPNSPADLIASRADKRDDVEHLADSALASLGDPETKAGKLYEGVTQFVAGMLPISRMAKGVSFLQGAGRAITAARGVIEGAAVSGLAFEGHEGNLANLARDLGIENEVTEFLATDEEDSELVGRLKNAVTDAGAGAVFEGFLASLRTVKAFRRMRVEAEAEPHAVSGPADIDLGGIKLAPKEAPAATAKAQPAAAPEAHPAATTGATEGAPEAQLRLDLAETDSTVKALDERQPTYSALAPDEQQARLRERLGITDDKLTQLREAVQRGEVKPENVSELIGMNAERIDWSGVKDAKDMVGLLNSITRLFDDATASAAGYKRVSIETMAQHASDMGGNFDEALNLWARMKDAPQAVMAQRATLMASAARLQRLAQKIRSGESTAADLLEFVTHEKRHTLLQVTARGTRAEIGRALRVMREGVQVNEDALKLANARRLRELRSAQGSVNAAEAASKGGRVTDAEADEALRNLGTSRDEVRQLADNVADAKTLGDLNGVTRSSLFHQTTERLASLYINNILSGLPTMAVNVASGLYKLVEASVENFGAYALGTLRGADRFERMAATKSTVAAFTSWRGAWKAAAQAWKEGLPQTDVLARHEGAARGSVITGHAATDAVLTAPSRAILTADEFFKHIFFKQELTARAVEVAANAARMEKTAAAQDATFARVLRDTLENPSDDLTLDAIEAARYNTFQANLESKFAHNLTRWTNETPLLKFVVPFIKTPLNILKQGIVERTPLALLSNRLRKQILSNDRAGRTAMLRTMLGTAGIGVVWNLAADGRVTGSRVGRGGNRNTADLGDIPAYSIRIGDRWYQYNRLDPMGTVLGLTADLRELANDLEARTSNDIESDNPELVEAFGNLLGIITENVADKTFFKGFADLVEAAHSASERGSGSAAAQYVASIGSNLVPFSSLQRNIAKAHDEYAREAWTFMDKLRASTPGISEGLPVRRDVLGRPVKNSERLGADWLSPFLVGKDDTDPAAKALAELEMSYRLPDKDIAGVRLNPEQYSRLLEVRGQFLREHIQEWIDAGEWYGLTKYQRTQIVRRLGSTATHTAEAAVMDQWPDLGERVQTRRSEAKGRKAGEIE